MKKLILIDSNALVHRAFHALPVLNSPKGIPVNAVYGFTSVLLKMLKDLKPDYIAATFDLAGGTFRHEEFAEYKAHRVKGPDELYAQIPLVKTVVEAFGIPIFEQAGFEADDLIGTLAEQAKKEKDLQVVIVTGDLDTLQLVDGDKVVVFTLRKGVTDTVTYNEKEVHQRYGIKPEQVVDFKGLKGDPSDNIPGVPGVGDKTASTLIQEFGSIEKLYEYLENPPKKEKPARLSGQGPGKPKVSEKLAAKLIENRDSAFFSKKLATIIRTVDITFDLKKTEWRNHLNLDAIKERFQEFGFYSLAKRLGEMLNGGPAVEQSSLLFEPSQPKTPVPVTMDDELIGHDLKPFIKEIVAQGKTLPKKIFDTRIAAWLLEPDQRDYEYSQVWAREYSSQSEGTPEELAKLKNRLRERMKAQKVLRVFEDIEMPLVPVLAAMEEQGIRIDTKALGKLSVSSTKELAILEKKIYDLAGGPFNINSPAQLGEILFTKLVIKGKVRKTGKGAPSTAAPELEKLRDEHPIIDLILDYRELQKLKTTYIEPFPTLVAKDGRIHTTYNQAGTGTGRLSSQDPNLQNIPTRTELGQEFRKAFIAEKGYALVSFDYTQLELRIAAHIAKDKKMSEAFKRGEDIHTRTAAEILKVAPDKITKDMRRQAKVLNFGILYGMGTLGFARAAGVDRVRAREFIDQYFAEFTGIARYMEATKQQASKQGYVETLFGRRRQTPDINSGMPQVRASAERMAINHPIQGTEADLVKLAMIQVAGLLEKEKSKARMLLQVHDELVCEIPVKDVPVLAEKIRSIMEQVYTLDVPLTVDVKSGDTWADMKPVKRG